MDTSRLSSAPNSTQDMPVVDASMLNSLGKARCLPSLLELDSSQELTVDPNMLMIDTSMLSSLDKARCLPTVLELDSSQELTVDPNILLIDTSMLSSLGKARCLPRVQEGMLIMNPNIIPNLSTTRIVL